MNAKANGEAIEQIIKDMYYLAEDTIGFDAVREGRPVEIKGCLPQHWNGVDSKGNARLAKGRFWIDNRAHRLLLKEDGIYIFVVYKEIATRLKLIGTKVIDASSLDKWIGNGDNTKIRYDWVFPELIGGDKL